MFSFPISQELSESYISSGNTFVIFGENTKSKSSESCYNAIQNAVEKALFRSIVINCKVFVLLLMPGESSHHIETSALIYRAIELTGFCMTRKLQVNVISSRQKICSKLTVKT